VPWGFPPDILHATSIALQNPKALPPPLFPKGLDSHASAIGYKAKGDESLGGMIAEVRLWLERKALKKKEKRICPVVREGNGEIGRIEI